MTYNFRGKTQLKAPTTKRRQRKKDKRKSSWIHRTEDEVVFLNLSEITSLKMLHLTPLYTIYNDKPQLVKRLFPKLLNFVARLFSLCFSKAGETLEGEMGLAGEPSLDLEHAMGKYPLKTK